MVKQDNLLQNLTEAQGKSSRQIFVQKMQDAGDRYANSIDFERKNIQTMDEQIHIMKQKVLSQRKAMGGINASKDNYFMIQKQIRILENRQKTLIWLFSMRL